MKSQRTKKTLLIIVAVICAAAVFAAALGLGKLSGVTVTDAAKPAESFAIINVIGTIQSGNEGTARIGYDHNATLSYIDELMEDETNTGIFLDVDSGGGTVYESDEMYLKLMEYKEKTGRPVHAYFNSTAASGAYYISCAADYISANRNCWTGSIGVIISTTNVKGLYDKLGIEEILITSGDNKGMGSAGSEMKEEHVAIYQALVNESYDEFVRIVAESRGYSDERAREIADGRIYSAKQALEIDLIDEISTYEQAVEYMEETTSSEGYYRQLYTPTIWEEMMADIEAVTPKSDMEVVAQLATNSHSGEPMYMYTE
ncbi:MAG: signal peptide peptidase SppA [Oscillospiraceae bacterium]|nr:signal peptide peptidase SppA [Oscillospiraceae bacterium]